MKKFIVILICSIIVIGVIMFNSGIFNKFINKENKTDNPQSVSISSNIKYKDPIVTAKKMGTNDVQTITIENPNNGSGNIYYSIDGKDPTTSSNIYYNKFDINSNCDLKCIIIDSNGDKSNIVKNSYTVENKAPKDGTAAASKAVNDKSVNTSTITYTNVKQNTDPENINQTNEILKMLSKPEVWHKTTNETTNDYKFEQISETEGIIHWMNYVDGKGLVDYYDGKFIAVTGQDFNKNTVLHLYFTEYTSYYTQIGPSTSIILYNDGKIEIDTVKLSKFSYQ